MGIIFFGSSDFSLPALQACLKSPFKILQVITTPDRRQGRGLKELPTPVRNFAAAHNLPCEAPETLKDPELIARMQKLHPQYFVISSYGKLIPDSWLKLPSAGSFNVHPSLLPRYRGAAPINWPLINGDAATGMSIIEIASRLDAGDIFYQKQIPILAEDDAVSLTEKLAGLSREALLEIFEQAQHGALTRRPQDESKATYARKLTKEDGKIDWHKSAQEIFGLVRGLLPWPGACTAYSGEALQILKARPAASVPGAKPGEVLSLSKEGSLRVQCGRDSLDLLRVKPAGKKEMSGFEFANGRRITPGALFA